jgi:hypothetical protein
MIVKAVSTSFPNFFLTSTRKDRKAIPPITPSTILTVDARMEGFALRSPVWACGCVVRRRTQIEGKNLGKIEGAQEEGKRGSHDGHRQRAQKRARHHSGEDSVIELDAHR